MVNVGSRQHPKAEKLWRFVEALFQSAYVGKPLQSLSATYVSKSVSAKCVLLLPNGLPSCPSRLRYGSPFKARVYTIQLHGAFGLSGDRLGLNTRHMRLAYGLPLALPSRTGPEAMHSSNNSVLHPWGGTPRFLELYWSYVGVPFLGVIEERAWIMKLGQVLV